MKTVIRRRFVAVCLLGLAVSACLSPTLPPLPPPGDPNMAYIGPNQLQLSGFVSSRRSTRVIAVNNHNDQVAGEVVRDGTYRFVISAAPRDEIELWYEVGADVSESLFLTAPAYDVTTDAGASGTGGGDAGASSSLPLDDVTSGSSDASADSASLPQ